MPFIFLVWAMLQKVHSHIYMNIRLPYSSLFSCGNVACIIPCMSLPWLLSFLFSNETCFKDVNNSHTAISIIVASILIDYLPNKLMLWTSTSSLQNLQVSVCITYLHMYCIQQDRKMSIFYRFWTVNTVLCMNNHMQSFQHCL